MYKIHIIHADGSTDYVRRGFAKDIAQSDIAIFPTREEAQMLVDFMYQGLDQLEINPSERPVYEIIPSVVN